MNGFAKAESGRRIGSRRSRLETLQQQVGGGVRIAVARDHLRSAMETFHLLDARPWAEQADGELRAAGEHVDRPTPAAFPLTAQQERIARLVADGATNREVAARMYLSPRTVDHHLRNVFIRLGVRSRTELARLMVSA